MNTSKFHLSTVEMGRKIEFKWATVRGNLIIFYVNGSRHKIQNPMANAKYATTCPVVYTQCIPIYLST